MRERERERVKTLSKNKTFWRKRAISCFLALGFLVFTSTASASSTNGTIDSTNRYAWSENAGWIDFGGSRGAVAITDSTLSGYAYGENIGWISLNCSNDNSCATVDYKVSNDGNGALSGYGWGENAGWVKFDPQGGGVTIDSSGIFSGYAYGENIGWIAFNCSTTNTCGTIDYKVSTDWIPKNARPVAVAPAVGNGPPGLFGGSFGAPANGNMAAPAAVSIPAEISQAVSNSVKAVGNVISSLIPSFLKPEPKAAAPKAPPPQEAVSQTTPPIFSGKLSLISAAAVGHFALAPLPEEIRALAKKFPQLGKTFAMLGVTKMSDLSKLQNAKFVLPGLSQNAGAANSPALALSQMTAKQIKSFPSEIVFAKTGDLIDYNIHLSMADGAPEQTINTVAGKTLDLVVKADKPVKSITGYLVVKNTDRQTARMNVPATSLMAAPIMAVLAETLPASQPVQMEKKMVLNQFSYQDKNNDGIYTAEIQAPSSRGEYQVISIIEYKNPAYGKKELQLTAVVDPEGYVYERNGDKETRIPGAKISLFWKNPKSGKFELWPAKDFEQVNPQKTDKSGTYSFLVPEGTYELAVSAPGYADFAGREFDVAEGSGVRDNIALEPSGWLSRFFNFFF